LTAHFFAVIYTSQLKGDVMRYIFTRADVELDCTLDYLPAEVGSTENGLKIEPDYPEAMELVSAQHRDIEMIGFLADYVVRDIQDEALALFKQDMRRQ
jgi:hypothetical protein